MDKIRIVPKEKHPIMKILLLAIFFISIIFVIYLWYMWAIMNVNGLLHAAIILSIVWVMLLYVNLYLLNYYFIINTQELGTRTWYGFEQVYSLKEIRVELFVIKRVASYQVIFTTISEHKIKAVFGSIKYIRDLEQMGFKIVNIGSVE